MEESMPLIHSYTTALLTLLRECKPPGFPPTHYIPHKRDQFLIFLLLLPTLLHLVPLLLNSDAGYAVVPLTLLGAPVNIGEALG